jgi:lysophospholipase L1-like esterase
LNSPDREGVRDGRFDAMHRAVAGVAAVLVLLGCGEVLLRVDGYVPRFSPLYRAFGGTRLFVRGVGRSGNPVWRTNPLYYSRFHVQEFARDKGKTFRIFVIGESAAAGWGLSDPVREGFSAIVSSRLSSAAPERSWEVVNAGGTSWGSERIRVLADELAARSPDLLVVYMGNNEFFEYPVARDLRSPGWNRAKLQRLLEGSALAGWMQDRIAGLERLMGRSPAARYEPLSEDAARDAEARFADNLRAVIRRARAVGAEVVCCELPANLLVDPDRPGDWLQDASRHRPDLDRTAWDAAWKTGEEAARAGQWRNSLAAFVRARNLDPGYARTYREIGRCHEELGERAGAFDAYWSHIDRSRRLVTRDLNAAIRRVEERVPLVDVGAAFARTARGGLPGYDLFVDSMHPNAHGHDIIAGALLPVVLRIAGPVRDRRDAPGTTVR